MNGNKKLKIMICVLHYNPWIDLPKLKKFVENKNSTNDYKIKRKSNDRCYNVDEEWSIIDHDFEGSSF